MEFGLIGEHLGHSYSREIHEKIADYAYELCEIAPENLEAFLFFRDFRGVNVTIPYKQAVMPYLDEITDAARSIGAVNTIVNRNGRLIGDNTDFAGMIILLAHGGIRVKGKKVLILGTGGTSKTAQAVVRSLGAARIVTVSRQSGADRVNYEEALRDHRDAQVILNTTPVGMYPDDHGMAIDPACFPDLEGLADAVYHPLRTDLVLAARKQGIPALGGLYMLCAQAVYASALFTSGKADETRIDSVYRQILREKENTVLIGMPTSGKTSVGRMLARKMGRKFLDTDDLVTDQLGQSIFSFVNENGEEAFRAVERRVMEQVSRESGCVIATGGGVVLSQENVRLLKKNGRLIFLDRAADKLIPSPDRPLSSDREKLEKMYAYRYPLYQSAADVRVDADGTVEEVTDAVERIWKA